MDRITPHTPTSTTKLRSPTTKTALVGDANSRTQQVVKKDRRKLPDRRQKNTKILLESRSGLDRRKSSAELRQFVDTEV